IDNVVPESRIEDTVKYKKMLGGLALNLIQQVHEFVDRLHVSTDETIEEDAYNFDANWISTEGRDKTRASLLKKLHKPLRVCGMVRNQGEPGGGPFWVKQGDEVSTQIIEKAQIQIEDPDQKKKVEAATHFNPVDLVCALKDYNGEKFDLHKFIDPETAFIAEKSMNGKTLKALELPGLWNGAMEGWNTVFVVVPLSTFNPVKTVNDLLRPEHQS
ncbi:MAG: DUF4301 family protein, partial [Flavobacteriales bacterium]|nr:DUF4301 family protein [Flavobacteriales bacterium]